MGDTPGLTGQNGSEQGKKILEWTSSNFPYSLDGYRESFTLKVETRAGKASADPALLLVLLIVVVSSPPISP